MLVWGMVWMLASQGVADEELFETLLDIETDVASAKKQTVRDSPGIVTVITREEIVRSGARDLADVLQLVPGFSFGVDVQGSVGVGVRGVWGQEGKVLVLFDGQEMNETLYLTPQFGNHYPIFTIERIEVIRGPGSAQYGRSSGPMANTSATTVRSTMASPALAIGTPRYSARRR